MVVFRVRKFLLLVLIVFCGIQSAFPQNFSLSGRIVDGKDKKPVEFASVLLPQNGLWAITNEKGEFVIKKIPVGKVMLKVQCLGYASQVMTVDMNRNVNGFLITLQKSNLQLNEVVVTAQKRSEALTTSYTIGRATLDHAQISHLANITSLLPGGKTLYDSNLATSDARIALHAGGNEMGNASFGTAIDIDGIRLENNALMSETKGVGLRNISSSNIESIEVITGIPSVEYGDLSNGMVKINTRRGKTPWIIEFSTEPKTKQVALSKGFLIGSKGGVMNVSFERTKSISNLASPHTAYDRNALSVTYNNRYQLSGRPLSMTLGFSGNVGGYDSEADPDTFGKDYLKQRDYNFRGSMDLNWLLNLPWITNLSLKASVNYADKLEKENLNRNSAATDPFIHSTEKGYFVSVPYDEDPNANVVLGPTGYWYQLSYHDQRPLTYVAKMKALWMKSWKAYRNRVMVGLDWKTTSNNGKGFYYDDMRYAPTWREYRYDRLPSLNNMALYAEEQISRDFKNGALLQLNLGIRYDLTHINGSEYGNAGSLSPRFNAKYIFFRNNEQDFSYLSVYGGVGKSVKLPSFEVLYPSPSYSDKLSFAPGAMADNTTYYAYYTQPNKALYNPDLKWQHTRQSEIGIEATVLGAKIAISGYYNKTFHPYMQARKFTPYTYEQTTQKQLEGCPIPSVNRQYEVDQETGKVTVIDKTGAHENILLDSKSKNTYYSNAYFTNGSPIERRGIDWVVDFIRIPAIRTSFRVDGNYYHYKGLDGTLVAGMPSSSGMMADGRPNQYVGYFRGGSATSSSYAATASVSNGRLSREVNMNFTITTHIPKIRMILSMRVESSLYNYSRNLCENLDGSPRGFVLKDKYSLIGNDYDIYAGDKYVAVYPEYYTTWEEPDKFIPFAEKFIWAKENDRFLYNELSKLVETTNTAYYFNEDKISAFCSMNLNLTKEIGDYASISFYAKNFFNHTGKIKYSQTGLKDSLFNSGYIPKYYYGLTLRLKI